MAQEDYAIIIGISQYSYLNSLEGAVNDAQSFCEWLISPQGGGVPEENITLIRSKDTLPQDLSLAEPNYAQIDAAFTKLIEVGLQKGGRAGRRLYIFMAGHGFGPEIDEAALLMANADNLYRIGFHIPGRRYAKWFQTAALFKEIVLFMDCCRDILVQAPPKLPPWPAMPSPAARKVDYFFGFATEWSSKAREQRFPDDGQVRGLFSCALVDALRHTASDERGRVTASAIAGYVQRYLRQMVQEGLLEPSVYERQRPHFDFPALEDFVFVQRRHGELTPVQITFSRPDAGQSVEIQNSDFQVVAARDSMVDVWEVNLAPSRYQILAPGSGRRQVFDVVGQEVTHVSF
jgi:hypothetical protein